ncbi:MAG: hypothetical protein ABSF28_05715 [Terracidiphilus sp.]|jgi:hypothetical protein
MRSDGPILLAVLFLAAGVTVIFTYGVGTGAFNAAYPLAGASLQLSIATAGPAAVGGLALVALGLLILAWSLICAVVGLFTPADAYRDNPARADRLEQKRLDREERLAQKRREREEKEMGREGRLFPRE